MISITSAVIVEVQTVQYAFRVNNAEPVTVNGFTLRPSEVRYVWRREAGGPWHCDLPVIVGRRVTELNGASAGLMHQQVRNRDEVPVWVERLVSDHRPRVRHPPILR